MSGTVWKYLPDVQEAISNVRKCTGVSLGCPGVVGSFSQMSRRGRDTLPNLPYTSGHLIGPPGHPGGPFEQSRTSERTYRTSSWASQTSGRAFRTLPDIREASWTSRRASHHSWTFGRAT